MKLFGTDGIRGAAGEGALSSESVARVAKATAYLLKSQPGLFRQDQLRRPTRAIVRAAKRSNVFGHNRVVIGRDTRISGPRIEEIMTEEFLAMGLGVLKAGVVPTSAVSFFAREWGVMAGIVISASHNPPGDNGIKIVSPQGLKIPDDAERGIEKLYFDSGFDPHLQYSIRPRSAAPKDVEERAVEEYVSFLVDRFKGGPPLAGLSAVADLAHGAATATAPAVFERFGLKPVVIHGEQAGERINVECGATNLKPLSDAVAKERASIGIAFDGDQDRALFVDERGQVVDGDRVLAICGLWLQSKRRLSNNVIVGTLMSNWGLEQLCSAHGIRLIRAQVGDRYVAGAMMEAGAVLGGEPSGHTIFFEQLPTGDGMITALQLMQIMRETGKPLSELASILSASPQILVSVPVSSKPPLSENRRVEAAIGRARERLGKSGRILVRYSGTEDLCRVMVEGEDERLIDRVAHDVSEVIRGEIGR
ncbi:MAG TPA: phosphoglucosamine mutase [Planctomycetota bacterium]|nr:phosphoglucosamine mutase [Planctomycetota bacterium]